MSRNKRCFLTYLAVCAVLFFRQAKQDLDINFLIGFETEVVFLREVSPPVAIDDTLYSSTASWHANTVGSKIADEVVDALTQQRIKVLQFHSESAPGQVCICKQI